jgi:hypothetical protein
MAGSKKPERQKKKEKQFRLHQFKLRLNYASYNPHPQSILFIPHPFSENKS